MDAKGRALLASPHAEGYRVRVVSRYVRRIPSGVVTEHGPSPLGEGVLVRVTSAGICGSDLHAAAGGPIGVVLGHEFGGRTDDGTLVAVVPHAACGACPVCARGLQHLCPVGARSFHGSTIDGGLADEVLVDPRCLVAVPEPVDPATVALVEPLAVAVHAVNRASIGADDRVLVIGGGSIGLLCAAVLLDRGISVDLVARYPSQVAAAEGIGAGTSPEGRYPVVVDAAGTSSSMEQATHAAERGGSIVLVALPWDPVPLGMSLVLKEV